MTKHRAVNGGLDQYFTPESTAKSFTQIVEGFAPTGAQWIEPSAGAGVFVRAAKKLGHSVSAYDLDPKLSYIKQQDWLEYEHKGSRPCVVFGNPPFGFAASLAVKFFNKAAQFADVIAFVLPASFEKDSVQNRLDQSFTLVYSELEVIRFEFPDGGTKAVPCVKQVWTRLQDGKKRPIKAKDFGEDLPLSFIKPAKEQVIVAIRRVGGRAGQIIDSKDGSENTTYFIKCMRAMLDTIKRADFRKYVNNTAGVRSLSKQELIRAVREAM